MEVNQHAFSQRALEDQLLVRQAIETKAPLAFERLMQKYKDSVYFMLLKMVHNRDDADDLTIEAFAKAFNNLEKYSTDFAFSTWLFKIATNNGIDFLRKKRIDTLSINNQMDADDDTDFSNNIRSMSPDPEEVFIKKQRAEQIKSLLEKLNVKYRVLIEKRYFEELSYEEIAVQMNLPLGTIKAQLFRAKELLYSILKGKKIS
jgi:RNA polymerase sigma factor (sigma-70 family)